MLKLWCRLVFGIDLYYGYIWISIYLGFVFCCCGVFCVVCGKWWWEAFWFLLIEFCSGKGGDVSEW